MIKKIFNLKFAIDFFQKLSQKHFFSRLSQADEPRMSNFSAEKYTTAKKVVSSKTFERNLINNHSAGMSLVELIVVLGIFAVLSTVVIFNYKDFQDRVDIKNLGSDIALKIVEAQKLSVNGMRHTLAGLNWQPSYGVYFDIAMPKQFIYFADLNNFNGYEVGSAEKLDTINITKNNYISRIDRCNNAGCSSPASINNPISVFFKRPDSKAIFSGALVTGSNYIQITVSSPNGAKSLIKVYPSGRIQVN